VHLLKKPGLAIFVICFVVRGVAALALELNHSEILGTRFDYVPDGYDVLGRNLVRHGTFGFAEGVPTAARGPLYPTIIGIAQGLFGERLLWLRLLMSAIDSFSCVLFFMICRQVMPTGRAFVISMIYIVYPFFIWSVLHLWSDMLIVFLMLAITLTLLRYLYNPSLKRGVVLGVVLGASLYVRGIFIFAPVIFWLLAAIHWKDVSWPRWIRYNSLVLVVMLLIIAPWTYRNFRAFGKPVLLETVGGFNSWVGNYWLASSDTARRNRTYTEIAQEASLKGIELLKARGIVADQLYEVQGDTYFKEYMVNWAIKRPMEVVRKCLFFFPKFWYVMDDKTKTLLGLVINVPIFAVALIGVYKLFRSGRLRGTVFIVSLTFILYFNVFHSLVVAVFRYALPVMPFVFLFAAEGLPKMGSSGAPSVLDQR
jgi:4-amino-4-deoxy-L-arabinose transferase-like glycosyltransferase